METETEGLTRIYRDYGPIIDTCCSGRVDSPVMAGLMWRESRGGAALTPPGAAGTGDGGHGRGLCQIDDRSWPAFTSSEDWKDPAKNIAFAVNLVAAEVSYFARFSLGHPTPYPPLQCALAAYNAGPSGVRRALARGEDVDAPTAHGNYSAEVLRLAGIYRDIVAQESRKTGEIDVTGFGTASI